MAHSFDSHTRLSLLGRMGHDPSDAAAWAEFVDHYGPRVLLWCRRCGLQEADAHDVTQDVLLRLAAKMKDFRYDPSKSFRAWLKTLTHHALSDFLEARRRSARGSGDSAVLDQLNNVEARTDLVRQLETEFDREVLELASERVRARVEAHTWEAFRLLAHEGLSGAEAAARLGLKVATVWVARSKVQKMLQEEVRRLEGGEEGVGPVGGEPDHAAVPPV
jgi:RNA polymerase sigma-70 factor (ECF subfamily)